MEISQSTDYTEEDDGFNRRIGSMESKGAEEGFHGWLERGQPRNGNGTTIEPSLLYHFLSSTWIPHLDVDPRHSLSLRLCYL